MEGLQKWRLRWEIWRGMQNGDLFRGPAEDGFLHQTSKFWSRGPYGGPAGDALNTTSFVLFSGNKVLLICVGILR
jgi:hypothetical protein